MITISRLYADEAGESGFKEISIPLVESGEIGLLSMPYAVEDLVLRETAATYDYAFHRPPARQFTIDVAQKEVYFENTYPYPSY